MTIALAKDVRAFLKKQVRDGVCSDPSELVNNVVRSLRTQQRRPFELTPELEAWLLESADKPVSPLKREDFAALRKRLRSRPRAAVS